MHIFLSDPCEKDNILNNILQYNKIDFFFTRDDSILELADLFGVSLVGV